EGWSFDAWVCDGVGWGTACTAGRGGASSFAPHPSRERQSAATATGPRRKRLDAVTWARRGAFLLSDRTGKGGNAPFGRFVDPSMRFAPSVTIRAAICRMFSKITGWSPIERETQLVRAHTCPHCE